MKSIKLLLFIFCPVLLFGQTLVPYRYNDKYGYADESGKLVIPAKFDEVNWFNDNGLASVKENESWGLINRKGEFVVTPKYTAIFSFHNGLAAVCTGGKLNWIQGEIVGGAWGYINENGEEAIPCSYHRAEHFRNGYAIVQTPGDNWGNWGVIDVTGKQILPYNYITYSFDMRPFPGLKWDEKQSGKLLYRPGQWDENWKQIDLKGKPTGKKVNDIHGEYPYEENTKTESVFSLVKFSENGLFGFKDKQGNTIIQAKYKSVSDFENGYAKVDMNPSQNQIPDQGYINEKGVEFFYSDKKIHQLKSVTGLYHLTDEYGNILLYDVYDFNILNQILFTYRKNGYLNVADSDGKISLSTNYNQFITSPASTDPGNAPLSEFYAGIRFDSIFIYTKDLKLERKMAGPWELTDKKLFEEKAMFIERKNRETLKKLTGEQVGKFFKKIYYSNPYFAVYGEKDSAALMNDQGQFISAYKPQNLLILKNHYVCFTYPSKSTTLVELYDYTGKKVNQTPMNMFNQSYNTIGLYRTRNDKTKKEGYYWNGIFKEAIYKQIHVWEMRGHTFIIQDDGTKVQIIDHEGNHAIKDEFQSVVANGEYAVVSRNGKYGILHVQHNQLSYLLPCEYEYIPSITNGNQPIAVQKNGKNIYIKPDGSSAFAGEFDYVSQFNGKLFAEAGKNGLSGILREDGSWLINPEYNEFFYYTELYENNIFAARKNGKVLLLNEEGKNMLPNGIDSMSFDYLDESDQVLILSGKKKGVIDFKGNVLVPVEYEDVQNYYVENNDTGFVYFLVKTKTGYGFLNSAGKAISKMDYDVTEQNDDIYMSAMLNLIQVKRDGKFGYLNLNGKEVLPCEHKRPYWYEEELVSKCIPMQKKGKYALIGMDGKLITDYLYDHMEPEWDLIDNFPDAKASSYYRVKQNGKVGIITNTGENIIEPVFTDFKVDYNCWDRAVLQIYQGKKYGVADISGKILIQPHYKSINCEYAEDRMFYILFDGKKYQITDESGTNINGQYYDVLDWTGDENLAMVKRGENWFFIKADGSERLIEE